jgi:hypothetical protein
MKTLLTIALTFALLLSANSVQEKKPSEAQAAIDNLLAEMKGTLAKATALDESDRKLALSNQTQIDTTTMLNRSESKIKQEEIPKVDERVKKWNTKRQQHIDGGCPANATMLPKPEAERCNKETDALMAEHAQIAKDGNALIEQLVIIEQTRRSVSETTIANAQKQKENRALRDELEATKKLQEGELRKLYADRITEALSTLESKQKASEACKSIKDADKLHCCNSVVWDRVSRAQCDVPLIYTLFEKAGLFATPAVKPH